MQVTIILVCVLLMSSEWFSHIRVECKGKNKTKTEKTSKDGESLRTKVKVFATKVTKGANDLTCHSANIVFVLRIF